MELKKLTFDLLRVFTLSNAEKAQYLGALKQGEVLVFPGGFEESSAEQLSHCLAFLSLKVFHEYQTVYYDNPAKASLGNVECLIEMALEIGRSSIDYFWNLDSEKGITGPFDNFWNVLQSLSELALKEHGEKLGAPGISFSEFLTFCGVTRIVKIKT